MTSPSACPGQAILLGAGQLRDAVDRGGPFETELQTVITLSGDTAKESLDVLATRLPQQASQRVRRLSTTFPALADEIQRAFAGSPRRWFLAPDLVPARHRHHHSSRIDGKGDGTEALLGRAEQDIRQGDLAAAVTELSESPDRRRRRPTLGDKRHRPHQRRPSALEARGPAIAQSRRLATKRRWHTRVPVCQRTLFDGTR